MPATFRLQLDRITVGVFDQDAAPQLGALVLVHLENEDVIRPYDPASTAIVLGTLMSLEITVPVGAIRCQ